MFKKYKKPKEGKQLLGWHLFISAIIIFGLPLFIIIVSFFKDEPPQLLLNLPAIILFLIINWIFYFYELKKLTRNEILNKELLEKLSIKQELLNKFEESIRDAFNERELNEIDEINLNFDIEKVGKSTKDLIVVVHIALIALRKLRNQLNISEFKIRSRFLKYKNTYKISLHLLSVIDQYYKRNIPKKHPIYRTIENMDIENLNLSNIISGLEDNINYTEYEVRNWFTTYIESHQNLVFTAEGKVNFKDSFLNHFNDLIQYLGNEMG